MDPVWRHKYVLLFSDFRYFLTMDIYYENESESNQTELYPLVNMPLL